MTIKKNELNRLCIGLMEADTEDAVINILNEDGYWENTDAWRYYGDRASNFNTIGNQMSRSDAALVEKLVNSVDARLINECLMKRINPEGRNAPSSIREAVAKFFDEGSTSSAAGLIREWPSTKRTQVAKGITLAATGHKPRQGNPCFVVADCGEGQTPNNLPFTLLSLDKDNKVKIPFVQGKFNMGGTGVLEFCGTRNLQLVLSKRNPSLLNVNDPKSYFNWGFTVVRREDPTGGRKTSVYKYLAPIGSDKKPQKGEVLSFSSETMPIFPEGQNPYKRESEWGTLIKLYEYATSGFSSSNILMSDGLMRQLDLLLNDLALPIRLYECRDYSGHVGSFETNLTGIGVRLEDDKGNNLEDAPYSFSMIIAGEKMTANIFVFKKGKADTYRSREGVIYSINGQTHGYLKTSFFKRKKVKLDYLADSLLVIIDCSEISSRSRELLFMPSRDRLREGELNLAIEKELEEILRNHPGLLELNTKRRKQEIETILEESKPLSNILEDLIKDSPTLTNLFLKGLRLPNPFDVTDVGEEDEEHYEGKKFPTYFKFKGLDYGESLERNCHINNKVRITFETDAENMYFKRNIDPGSFSLFRVNGLLREEVIHSISLSNGIANLTMPLPDDIIAGEKIDYVANVDDITCLKPYSNYCILNILGPQESTNGGRRKRRRPPSDTSGKDREIPAGLELPNIVEVSRDPSENQKKWDDMTPPFDENSAIRIKHAGALRSPVNDDESKDVYDFFVNVDNLYLKTEQKMSKEDPDVLRAKFVNGLVLMGLSVINYDIQEGFGEDQEELTPLDDKVEQFSQAIAPVLIPMINELGGLELEN